MLRTCISLVVWFNYVQDKIQLWQKKINNGTKILVGWLNNLRILCNCRSASSTSTSLEVILLGTKMAPPEIFDPSYCHSSGGKWKCQCLVIWQVSVEGQARTLDHKYLVCPPLYRLLLLRAYQYTGSLYFLPQLQAILSTFYILWSW